MGRMSKKKPAKKEKEAKPAETHEAPTMDWIEQTPETPFWNEDGPVEVMLTDETREQFNNPSRLKQTWERHYKDIVLRWRRLPADMIN